VLLSAENRRQLWVPSGFAFGFYVTSEVAEFQYKRTDYYAPEHERCIRWDAPELGIGWPLASAGAAPLLSDKDRHGLSLADAGLYD
jgi:dTDP-4-dehydrorhamnose 3,5-epimerase